MWTVLRTKLENYVNKSDVANKFSNGNVREYPAVTSIMKNKSATLFSYKSVLPYI